MVVSPCDIWGRTSQILFCDANDDDSNYKYRYEDDDDIFLLHLRRGNSVFYVLCESPTFFAGTRL